MAAATPTEVTGLAINGVQMSFRLCQPTSQYLIVDPNDQLITGSLEHRLEFLSQGIELHGFKCLLEPHPGELETLVPFIGYTESNDLYTPTSTLPAVTCLLRLKSDTAYVNSYAGCKVNYAIFRGQMGGHPLSLELDIWALTMTPAGSTFSPTVPTYQAPYAFTKGALTLGGATRAYNSHVWVRNNNLRRRINNAVTADVIQPTNQVINFGVNTPFTNDEDDLLDTAVSSTRTSGIAGELTYTNGTKRLIFTHLKLVQPKGGVPPVGPKPEEVRYNQYYKAFAEGANHDHTITQDNT